MYIYIYIYIYIFIYIYLYNIYVYGIDKIYLNVLANEEQIKYKAEPEALS